MNELTHSAIVKNLHWQDEAATQAFAADLAERPALCNAFIELRGDLGTGKTTLVRHLLHALGLQGRIKSPTYAVVEPYELRLGPAQDRMLNIWHFDFYRFQDPREVDDAGFRDIFSSLGLKLAEWPEKAAGFIPSADLVIQLEILADESRRVTLRAQTPIGCALLLGVSP
jgi:tRNA threonylcarbamoyladenosine biosynthesis protein TsaE